MADKNQPVIIIRRKKKGGHGGHHGGSWKVAYADFVTAMMSFFLLMWLLNVTTSDQRRGIADYFAPASVSRSMSGAGGPMGGQTITVAGARLGDSTPTSADAHTVPTAGKGEEGDEDTRGKSDKADNAVAKEPSVAATPQDEASLADMMKREEEQFKEAETAMKKALSETPGLEDLGKQLIIDRTPEGLRIQIVDRDKFSMFPSGGAIPYERGRDLLRLVGTVIAKLPNNVSVTGHTDASPFPAGSRRDNWNLSSERANISRSELVFAGVNEQRIARVVGMADREPLVPQDPKDSRNRRISIVLLRHTVSAQEPEATAPAPTPPQAP
jgi:chemotaxis protein MotB